MPQMSGPELITAVKEDPMLGSTPMILLTAKSDDESKVLGTEIGANAFLGKPFNDQELTSLVRNMLSLDRRMPMALSQAIQVFLQLGRLKYRQTCFPSPLHRTGLD